MTGMLPDYLQPVSATAGQSNDPRPDLEIVAHKTYGVSMHLVALCDVLISYFMENGYRESDYVKRIQYVRDSVKD